MTIDEIEARITEWHESADARLLFRLDPEG